MRRRTLSLTSIAVALALAACGGGGIRPRLFPPTLSVQQLAVTEDGRWNVTLRLQNFSNVPMRLSEIDATLRVAGLDAAPLRLQPELDVGPETAEIHETLLTPSAAAADAVRAALEERRSLSYVVEGEIRSTQPDRRRDDFFFQSQLSPVPGLAGVLR